VVLTDKTPLATPHFFEDLSRFGQSPALIDARTGEITDYVSLALAVDDRKRALREQFQRLRPLVFLEARNDPAFFVDYLACLQLGCVLHLVESLNDAKTLELLGHYRPNLLMRGGEADELLNERPIDLHPDLTLLLSTSGSTGSPKFVKLSAASLEANARSIAHYLKLNSSERAFHHLKAFYSYGLSVIHSHLAVGASLILTDASVNEARFWSEFSASDATSFAGVPYTFETLKQMDFAPEAYPSLRYATQAGGRLEATLVKMFAQRFNRAGRALYVMYGQTEAAPRMSYLPAELAERHPGSIGLAIPGGRLSLIDEEGRDIDEPDRAGELVYEGPNIMMGYAEAPEDLSRDDTPVRLLTGDIAVRDSLGLFSVVGRSSRFVKPFGTRLNLDEVQTWLKSEYKDVFAVAGDDRLVVIALTRGGEMDVTDIERVAARFSLPSSLFVTRAFETVPTLPNGKLDYASILMVARLMSEPPRGSFFERLMETVKDLLGLSSVKFSSVAEMLQIKLSQHALPPHSRFADLGIDSLAYVGVAIEIESLFDAAPPPNWQGMTLDELEKAHLAHKARVEF
jgi:acyl-CoA synthetase (AMP-forming)/AMP-acid ligase II